MPKPYSGDLRKRVIGAVEEGASRREAGERFEISASSSIRWLQRWHESGSMEPKPHGGSVSPLEEFTKEILALVTEKPDLTLIEMVSELRRGRIQTSKSALSRFFARHDITVKKKPAGGGTRARRRGPRTSPLDSAARHA
jgi:transposase